jgi:hypothetical protein
MAEQQQWHYLVRTFRPDARPSPPAAQAVEQDLLNHYGVDGWELAVILPGEGEMTYYFKKPGRAPNPGVQDPPAPASA